MLIYNQIHRLLRRVNMDINRIKGIITPIVTPIDEYEKINENGFRNLLRYSVDKGIHGIFVAGSSGEATNLLGKERNRAIKIALDEVGNDVPVLCGAIESSTAKQIENLKAIEQMGGEYAVVTSTYYIRLSSDTEIINHFEKLALSTSLKLIIYNIPMYTQINIKPEIVFELSKIKNIIGLKDSSGNIVQFQKCLKFFNDTEFKVFQGVTDIAGISMLLGADGCIPVLSPLFPEIFIELYEAAISRNLERLAFAQNWVIKTSNILSIGPNNISSAKYAISLLGHITKNVTIPFKHLSSEEEERIMKTWQDIITNCSLFSNDGKEIV